jgi:hypothetical protein
MSLMLSRCAETVKSREAAAMELASFTTCESVDPGCVSAGMGAVLPSLFLPLHHMWTLNEQPCCCLP